MQSIHAAGQDDLDARIRVFLDAHHVMTLATVAGGLAHAASLMYAHEGLTLYWTSDPTTRHSRAVEAHPRGAVTIAPDYTDFRAIRGLQITGRVARLATEGDVARARTLMAARYPFLAGLAQGPEALRVAWGRAGFYVLRPEWITLIDNTLGFGHKQTLSVSA
ncbi:MAG: pyridoxamine 5'-phosphate oxidase family protein [Burkholderiales bacterium]|nr:pyridoxamine 5'-phosphate oxidase family protein [Burkholderiales bacterium]